jgi:hypothetical protein
MRIVSRVYECWKDGLKDKYNGKEHREVRGERKLTREKGEQGTEERVTK